MNTAKSIMLALFAFGAGIALSHALLRPSALPPAPSAATKAEPTVLYWYDPMVPDQHFDRPGKSPFMDMMLVPKYAEDAVDGVAVDADLRQALGTRIASARQGELRSMIRVNGLVEFDQRLQQAVSARVEATVRRLYARAELQPISASAPLLALEAPTWLAAQREYLSLRQAEHAELRALAAAARARLLLLGISEAEINRLEQQGEPTSAQVIRAAHAGVLSELSIREGQRVMPGELLMRIQGLDQVWVELEIPERALAQLQTAGPMALAVAAFPDQRFEARLLALLPSSEPGTRSVRARLEVDNPAHRLQPGMSVSLDLASLPRPQRILVPSEALIRTGSRDLLIVLENDRFRAREVTVGAENDSEVEILAGIDAGARVVRSAQFLLDSEASLSGFVDRLAPAEAGSATTPASSVDHESAPHEHGESP